MTLVMVFTKVYIFHWEILSHTITNQRGIFMAKRKKTASKQALSEYWQKNLGLIKLCLVVWGLVSFGFAILLRPYLANIEIGGTDLGFWFAQQGSILCFLAIIFFYTWRMNKLDHEYDVDDDA